MMCMCMYDLFCRAIVLGVLGSILSRKKVDGCLRALGSFT